MRHVLILGGAGYIGTVLTGYLLRKDYAVTVVDNFIYKNNLSVLPWCGEPGFKICFADICDLTSIDAQMSNVTDVVILAGLVGDPITKKYPLLAEKINEQGIRAIIGALNGKGLNRVIFVSTCSNYGLIPDNIQAREDYVLTPLSSYAQAKVDAENYLLGLKGKVDFSPTVLRFATAFGLSPRMRFDLTISEFTKELALGKTLEVYDADTWRPYCHVKDFAYLIELVLGADREKIAFEVFNAGGDRNNFTKRGIVREIQQKLPNSKVVYQDHGSDPRNYRVNFKRVSEVLGFSPRYSVEQGIQELLDAFDEKVFRYVEEHPRDFGNYEISMKLTEST